MGARRFGTLADRSHFRVFSRVASGIDQQRGARRMVDRGGDELLLAAAVFVHPHNDLEKGHDLDDGSRLDRSSNEPFRQASIDPSQRFFR